MHYQQPFFLTQEIINLRFRGCIPRWQQTLNLRELLCNDHMFNLIIEINYSVGQYGWAYHLY